MKRGRLFPMKKPFLKWMILLPVILLALFAVYVLVGRWIWLGGAGTWTITTFSDKETARIYKEIHWPFGDESTLRRLVYVPLPQEHLAYIHIDIPKAYFDEHAEELAYRRDTTFTGSASDELTIGEEEFLPIARWKYDKNLDFFLYDLSDNVYGVQVYDLSPSKAIADIVKTRDPAVCRS